MCFLVLCGVSWRWYWSRSLVLWGVVSLVLDKGVGEVGVVWILSFCRGSISVIMWVVRKFMGNFCILRCI